MESSLKQLRELGYTMKDRCMVDVETGAKFNYINQDHYVKITRALMGYIQAIMETEYMMHRLELPLEEDLNTSFNNPPPTKENEPKCPVFLSANSMEATHLLVLLCGTGDVPPGQWSRKCCINDSLDRGSVLPFLDWAKKYNVAVLVLNPNRTTEQSEAKEIPFNESADAHVAYAWKTICEKLPKVQKIAIVAHSHGGWNACRLLKQGEELLQKLICVAFTDSIHSSDDIEELPLKAQRFIVHRCVHWIASNQPLATNLSNPAPDRSFFDMRANNKHKVTYNCMEVSAGTLTHEETTAAAFESICDYIESMLQLKPTCDTTVVKEKKRPWWRSFCCVMASARQQD